MGRGNIFERLLRRKLADILTLLVTMTREWLDFYKLWADFQELGRYLTALRTLN